jgi:hypothetical protein
MGPLVEKHTWILLDANRQMCVDLTEPFQASNHMDAVLLKKTQNPLHNYGMTTCTSQEQTIIQTYVHILEINDARCASPKNLDL